MTVLDRLKAWRLRDASGPETGADSARDQLDEEILRHDLGGVKEDTFVAGGNGYVTPGLPETTSHGVYEEFEHDEQAPADPAP
ncbi:MAG: hypothetical protein ACRC50_10825 [Gaiella sp.]